MKTDVMVLCAHPDDAELSCSGTIKNLTREGKTVVLVNCTRGELGTRGTPEIREHEAELAAEVLGVSQRVTLSMPDGAVARTQENITSVIEVIRRWQPTLLLIPPPFERHPDHESVHHIARSAAFLSGLARIRTFHDNEEQVPYRPQRMICFEQTYSFPRLPDFYVDITESFQAKMDSIKAFASQFHVPERYSGEEPHTYLSRPEFLEEIEARALHHGSRIGVRYAEAFLSVEPLGLPSLSVLL